MAHHAGDGWRVVRMGARGMRFTGGERHTRTQARPEPGQDPRPLLNRRIPPYGPN